MQYQTCEQAINENEDHTHAWLEEKQSRVEHKNEEQRYTRLEDMRHRAFERNAE